MCATLKAGIVNDDASSDTSRNKISLLSKGNIQVGACPASKIAIYLIRIGASDLSAIANPVFGIASDITTKAISLIFKITCIAAASRVQMLMKDIQQMIKDSLIEHKIKK